MIWREILLQLLSLSGDEGVEHKCVVPSAVSTETHKELTIRQLLHHLGFFASDAVLENAVSGLHLGTTSQPDIRPGDLGYCEAAA